MITALRSKLRYELAVSRYDRAASALMAALMVVGSGVLLLLGLWATWNRSESAGPLPPPTKWLDASGAVEGLTADLDEPGLEDLDSLPEPQLASALAAVTDLVSRTEGGLEKIVSIDETSGKGGGSDDVRKPGKPRPDDGHLPPKWERWQVQYNTSSLDAYAAQLDRLGIELGAAGGGRSLVDFVSDVSQARPKLRSAPGESRLFFSWKNGRLKSFDRRLLLKANVKTEGRVILQFYPPALIEQMELAEREAAKRKGLKRFTRTVFRLLPAGSHPPLEVVSIR